MRKADLVVSLLFMVLGIVVVFDSVQLGFQWGANGPESGFFPFYLGVGLIISSLLVLRNIQAAIKKGGSGGPLMPEGALTSILWVVVPALVMVVLTELVGLHIAAALYLAFYMRAVGKIGWAKTLMVSILVPLSLYFTFDKFFLIPLPQGLWGAILIPF